MLQEIELETNLSRSIVGALWLHKYIFERRFRFREILHPTRATFETISSSTVVEPFVDLWTPSALVFMIAYSSSTADSVAIQTSRVHWPNCALVRRRLSKQGAPKSPK